jgi:hypothetical protein
MDQVESLAMDATGARSAAAASSPIFGQVLYPHTYVWYVFVSALDVLFTRVMLHFGGYEVNQLANWVLQRWDIAGMVLFKFALVTLVICICEFVGRKRYRVGRDLGYWAVGITWIPVLLAALQLISFAPLQSH